MTVVFYRVVFSCLLRKVEVEVEVEVEMEVELPCVGRALQNSENCTRCFF